MCDLGNLVPRFCFSYYQIEQHSEIIRAYLLIAWEKSQNFVMPQCDFPIEGHLRSECRNSILTASLPKMGVVLMIGWNKFSEGIWVMMHHQHGISALSPQSFTRETSDGIMNYQLFSKVTELLEVTLENSEDSWSLHKSLGVFGSQQNIFETVRKKLNCFGYSVKYGYENHTHFTLEGTEVY